MDQREYAYKVVDGTPIDADVYWSTSQQSKGLRRPIAVHFHGGSFVVGSKALLKRAQAEKLVELGFVVVSANYRLCPTIGLYDGPITDSLDAFKWAQSILPGLLHKDAGIQLDGTKVVALGHSCGATLALLTAGLPNPPLAILDVYGMKYFKDPAYHNPATGPPPGAKLPDQLFIDQIHNDVPAPSIGPAPIGPNGFNLGNYRVAWMFSKIGQGKHLQAVVGDDNFDRVDPALLFSSKDFPATCFVHGTADTLVDQRFSRRAHDDLKSHGVTAHLELVEGAGHGFDAAAQPGDKHFAVITRAFEFLRDHVA